MILLDELEMLSLQVMLSNYLDLVDRAFKGVLVYLWAGIVASNGL